MEYQAAVKKICSLPPSRVVLFVGSGLVADLGFPIWKGLISKMVEFVRPIFSAHADTMQFRLTGGDLVGAADPAFEREIPALDRVRFFKELFRAPQQLNRRHRILGNLPVAAFVTTNFDEVLEVAIQLPKDQRAPRRAIVFTGSDRFQRFNSELSLYRDDYHLNYESKALVLKIHNDINDPEGLVLSSRSFSNLPTQAGYRTFYENVFRQYSVIFVGFSGSDQNLLDIVAREVEGYAGYNTSESFFLLPHGTPVPDAINRVPYLHAVHYSPDNRHHQLEEFLEQLNAAWSAPSTQERIQATKAYEDAEPEALGVSISIFDLMIPSFRGGIDQTVVDSLKSYMVRTGVSVVGPTPNPRSVANIVTQKFGLSVEHAQRLVEEHKALLIQQPDHLPASSGEDFVTVLARGVLRRAHAFDSDFHPDLTAIKPAIRSSLESAMKAYGANLALSILQSERPSRLHLSDTLRSTLRAGRWPSISAEDKEILTIVVADLFMEPSPEEAEIISKMSVTAVAFGIIQAFPDTNLSETILPTRVYLDATCVLPAVAGVSPRSNALIQLVAELRSLRRPVLFLRGFVNEVKTHLDNAKKSLQQNRLETIGDVRQYVGSSSEVDEFQNVFLLALSRMDCDSGENSIRCLNVQFEADSLPLVIERLGIRIVDAADAGAESPNMSALKTMILSQKKQWYGRSLNARDILARNEARQLHVMQQEMALGEKPWFATDDAQLRRIARANVGLDNLSLLPVSGIASIIRAMSSATQYSSLYPRLLWSPDWNDRADLLVAKALRDMLSKIDKGIKLPLAEARDLAVRELMRRADGPEDSVPVYGSVYDFLGKAIMQAKGEPPARK